MPNSTTPTPAAGTSSSGFTFGPLQLAEENMPEGWRPALAQMLAEHTAVNGVRTVNAFGPSWKPHTLKFRFFEDAEDKIKLLTRMTASGLSYRLSWLFYNFDIAIEELDPAWSTQFDCTVEVSYTVVTDLSGLTTFSGNDSIDSAITDQLSGSQAAFTKIVAVDPAAGVAFNTPLQAIDKSIKGLGPVGKAAGTAQLAQLTKTVQTAANYAQSYRTVLAVAQGGNPLGIASILTAFNPKSGTFSNASPTGGLIPGSGTFIAQLQAAVNLQTSLKQLGMNLQRGQVAQTVTQTGGNLAQTAVRYFKDATKAGQIRDANGLYSTQLVPGVATTLRLPVF